MHCVCVRVCTVYCKACPFFSMKIHVIIKLNYTQQATAAATTTTTAVSHVIFARSSLILVSCVRVCVSSIGFANFFSLFSLYSSLGDGYGSSSTAFGLACLHALEESLCCHTAMVCLNGVGVLYRTFRPKENNSLLNACDVVFV